MPLSSRSLLVWEPTPNTTDALPATLNLSTTASTTAYHSAAHSFGRTESYPQSSATGNTFDTSHSSICGPSHVASTLPGSSSGGTTATTPAGFPYRWRHGVVSRPTRSSHLVPASRPQRLLTCHALAPLLPTSEELLQEEEAEIQAKEASVHARGAQQHTRLAASTSPFCFCAPSPLVAAVSSCAQELLPRTTRQRGDGYLQLVQRRCKAAAVLPYSSVAHATVAPGCASCRHAMTSVSPPRISPKRSLSSFEMSGGVSTPQLLMRQWHWTGGSRVQHTDAAAANGAVVVAERSRLATSCLASIASAAPFSSLQSRRAVSGASRQTTAISGTDGNSHPTISSSNSSSSRNGGTLHNSADTRAEEDRRVELTTSALDTVTHQSPVLTTPPRTENGGVSPVTSHEVEAPRPLPSESSASSQPPPAEHLSRFALPPAYSSIEQPEPRASAAGTPQRPPPLLVRTPVTTGSSSSSSSTSAPASPVSIPLRGDTTAMQRPFTAASVRVPEPVGSAAAGDVNTHHQPRTSSSASAYTQPQGRLAGGGTGDGSSVSVALITDLAMARNESQLASRPSSATSAAMPVLASSTTNLSVNRHTPSVAFTPEFAAAATPSAVGGGGGSVGQHSRDFSAAFPLGTPRASPTAASPSPASPLVFRPMPAVSPSTTEDRLTQQQQQQHLQLPPALPHPLSSSSSSSPQQGGDAAFNASAGTPRMPEWSVEHAPLPQPRSQGNSFASVGGGAATTSVSASRGRAFFAIPATSAPTTAANSPSPPATRFPSFGAVQHSPQQQQQQPGFGLLASPLTAAPMQWTPTSVAGPPPRLPFKPPAAAEAEERTSPLWRTPRLPSPQSANPPFALPAMASASSSVFVGRCSATSPRQLAARATPSAGFPNEPHANCIGNVEGEGSSAALPSGLASAAACSPLALFPAMKDSGVLLVVPAGIVVTSKTSVATDRFSWSTTTPPDAALAVVERRVGTASSKAESPLSASSAPALSSLADVVECVITYFPVHTDVLKRHSGFFAALFGDSGSPYVLSKPDEYVDLADLPHATTGTMPSAREAGGEAAGSATPLRKPNSGSSSSRSETAPVTHAGQCPRGCRLVAADDVGEMRFCSRQSGSLAEVCTHTPECDNDTVSRDSTIASSTCVPVYYVRGPGCDGGVFSSEPWRHPHRGDEARRDAEGPQLSAAGVAQLIHYFYTGALPLFHSNEDIVNARSGLLKVSSSSGFPRQFAEIFSMGYYTSLNSLTQAMLNVLWRLLSISRDALPMWSAAVEWRLPDVQALCEQWIEKHLSLFLRANTPRGLWRGLDVSQVELLVALRTNVRREAMSMATETDKVEFPEPLLTSSPNTSGAVARYGNGSTEDATGADTRATRTAPNATSLPYGSLVSPSVPPPLSSGGHVSLPSTQLPHSTLFSAVSDHGGGSNALRSASPPLPPPFHSQGRPTSPASPASQASQHFDASPVDSFASGRRVGDTLPRRWSSPARSRAMSNQSSTQDDTDHAEEPAQERGEGASTLLLTASDVTATVSTALAASEAIATAAPPLIPVVRPPLSRPAFSPVLPVLPPRTLSADRSGDSSSGTSSLAASPTLGNHHHSIAVSSVAAQQFWLDSRRPSPLGTAASLTATPGALSTTSLAFEEIGHREGAAGDTRSAHAASAEAPPHMRSPGERSGVAQRAFEQATQQQQQQQQQRHREVEAATRPEPSSRTSGHISSDVSVVVPMPTSAGQRNSYIHVNASTRSNSSAMPSTSISPALFGGGSGVAPPPRTLLNDSRPMAGLHNATHTACSWLSLSNTPQLHCTPALPFTSTNWMVVPPTLQLLADGAWRIGGYGRLYTVETRETLEERQVECLRAEQEQHQAERSLQDLLLSEEELLERLWTWWTAYTEDIAKDGGSVSEAEEAAVAAMLRSVRFDEVQEAAVSLSSAAKSGQAPRDMLAEMVEKARCFLDAHPEPRELCQETCSMS